MEQTQKQKNGFMMKLATFIVDKRNLFLLITIILLVFSAFSRNWVEVENDQTAYLPASCETKQALNEMSDQFTTYGTAEVMVANITYDEAEALSGRIGAVKGVQSVAFDETSGHYARASALFTVTFDRDETDDACLTSLDAVKELLADYDLFVSTDLGNTLAETIDSEVSVIMAYVAVIIVAVLILTSRTYGEVPALLLTFIAAMVFMQFKIDPDMGICLMKSILFALLAVFIVMPGLRMLFVLPQILLLGGGLADKTSISMPTAARTHQSRERVFAVGLVTGEISGTVSGLVCASVDGNVNLRVISGRIADGAQPENPRLEEGSHEEE